VAAKIEIVIADDHPIVRQGLRQAIEREATLTIMGEAGDGRSALELIQKLKPRIAVLDMDMPEMDGLTVAREIKKQRLPVAVVFLTVHRDGDLFQEALSAGAQGYILKDSAMNDIVAGLKAVAGGNHFTSPALTTYLIKSRERAEALTVSKPELQNLTPAERRILRLIAEYKTSKQIADELCISPRTVETHRTNISQKLGLHGSLALMKFALKHSDEL